MKPLTIPIAELKPALSGLGKIISRQSTLPVLSHVRIERTSSGHLELAATDLEHSAIVRLPSPNLGEPCSLLAPLESLAKIARDCTPDVWLNVKPLAAHELSLGLSLGNGQVIEHRCESLPAKEFPGIPEAAGEPTVLAKSVRDSVHEAMQCASEDETRLILNGTYLDVSNPQGHYVVATDGRHLYGSNSFTLALKESVLIPSHRFLGWKEFNHDGDWKLRLVPAAKDAEPHVEIATDHWRFVARCLEGNYPNWRQVVPNPDSYNTRVEFDPKFVSGILQTVAQMPNHNLTNFTIGLELIQGRARLLGRSAGADQWSRVDLNGVSASGPDVTVFLNRHLLAKALRFGLTRLEIIDAMAPLRFSHGGRQIIIMPVRPEAAAPIRSTAPAPAPATETPPPNTPAEQPTKEPMPEKTDTNGATSSTATPEKPALESATAQVEAIKGDLRNALAGLNKLAEQLRQTAREQKATEKEISSVRTTLRQIQAVRL